jgi:hypothetical protein
VVADKWVALRGGLPDRLDALLVGRDIEFRSGNQRSVAGVCRVAKCCRGNQHEPGTAVGAGPPVHQAEGCP